MAGPPADNRVFASTARGALAKLPAAGGPGWCGTKAGGGGGKNGLPVSTLQAAPHTAVVSCTRPTTSTSLGRCPRRPFAARRGRRGRRPHPAAALPACTRTKPDAEAIWWSARCYRLPLSQIYTNHKCHIFRCTSREAKMQNATLFPAHFLTYIVTAIMEISTAERESSPASQKSD